VSELQNLEQTSVVIAVAVELMPKDAPHEEQRTSGATDS